MPPSLPDDEVEDGVNAADLKDQVSKVEFVPKAPPPFLRRATSLIPPLSEPQRRIITDATFIVMLGIPLSLLQLASLNDGSNREWAFPLSLGVEHALRTFLMLMLFRNILKDECLNFQRPIAISVLTAVTFAVTAVVTFLIRRSDVPFWPKVILSILSSIVIVCSQFIFPLTAYYNRHGFPRCCSRADAPFWIAVFPSIILFFLALSSAHAGGGAFLLSSAVIVVQIITSSLVIILCLEEVGEQSKLRREVPIATLAIIVAGYAPIAIMTLARVVETALENREFLELAVFVATCAFSWLAIEMLEVMLLRLSRERQEQMLVATFPVQFTMEFALGAIFIDARLDGAFFVLLFLSGLRDVLKESGLLYEPFYNCCLADRTRPENDRKGLYRYVLRKYIIMQQKFLAEIVSAPLFIMLITVEYHVAGPVGLEREISAQAGDDDYGLLMAKYAIVMASEYVSNWIGARLYDSRIERLRGDAVAMQKRMMPGPRFGSGLPSTARPCAAGPPPPVVVGATTHEVRLEVESKNDGGGTEGELHDDDDREEKMMKHPGEDQSASSIGASSRPSCCSGIGGGSQPSRGSCRRGLSVGGGRRGGGGAQAPSRKAPQRVMSRRRSRSPSAMAARLKHQVSRSIAAVRAANLLPDVDTHLHHAKDDRITFIVGGLNAMLALYFWKNTSITSSD